MNYKSLAYWQKYPYTSFLHSPNMSPGYGTGRIIMLDRPLVVKDGKDKPTMGH